MTIDRRDYIIFGWKLSGDIKNSKGELIDLSDDKFLPMIEGHKGEEYRIIHDGISGAYNVFGLEIANDGGKADGWSFLNLSLISLGILNTGSIKENLIKRYMELFDHEPKTNPQLFIFSHFN